MAENEIDLGEEKKSSKKLVFIVGGVLSLLLVIGATLYFAGFFANADDSESEEQEVAETSEEVTESLAIYHPLEPDFIINFPKGQSAKLFQVGITVLAKSEIAVEALKQHSPMIRNNLLMLLNGQKPEALRKREGKEALQASVLEEIQKVVDKQADGKEIEEVFFTGFVMQ